MTASGKFAGKKALVFGGTSGIGLAAVNQLREQGAQVVAISRDPSKAGDIPGVTLEACDVRDVDALNQLFAAHAPFDLLISAATGGSRAAGPFLQMDLAAYQASLGQALGLYQHRATWHRAFDRVRRYRIGEWRACTTCKTWSGCFGLGRGAVEQFARAVAPELAPRRINVVSPGVIDTPMFGPDADARVKMLKAPQPGI
ncbi:MAG: short chain dehydrogenase [Pseudomonadota bacterium]|nr:MAG: short chain dehydrogenase [Pseudomonadota bacterium]